MVNMIVIRTRCIVKTDSTLFSIKLHHGGVFPKSQKRKYNNGKITFVDMIDSDEFFVHEIVSMLEDLGHDGHRVMFYHFLKPSRFKAGMRDLLGLDGAFMKGPYLGQLLITVGVDLNNGTDNANITRKRSKARQTQTREWKQYKRAGRLLSMVNICYATCQQKDTSSSSLIGQAGIRVWHVELAYPCDKLELVDSSKELLIALFSVKAQCMRTRNSNFPNNSNVTIPRRRNKGRAPNIVEPELRTIVAPMAEHTMEELLRAPTEGYGEAIVLPEINADHFEIKTNLLQLVQANPFHGLENENPHAHINSFKRITSTLRFRNVLMMFPFSLEGAAKTWYEKEPPNSILTWEDLVTEFERFKEMLRACPHHGFMELTQVDTFYNGLNDNDQDSLNATAVGNLLSKTTREALNIIENKSKVRYSRNKPNASRMNTTSRESVSKTDERIVNTDSRESDSKTMRE
ncbi:hypothetical protein Tco_0032694 [Tanacetum coccineum]